MRPGFRFVWYIRVYRMLQFKNQVIIFSNTARKEILNFIVLCSQPAKSIKITKISYTVQQKEQNNFTSPGLVQIETYEDYYQINRMPKTKIVQDQSYQRVPSNKYTMISSHTKSKLCMLVAEKKQRVNSAAKSLKLNVSTAKLIVKKFNSLTQQQKKSILIKGNIPKCQKPKSQEQDSRRRIRKRTKKQPREEEKEKEELYQEMMDQRELKQRQNTEKENEIELKSEPKDTYMIKKMEESMGKQEETPKVEPQYLIIPMVFMMPYYIEIKQQRK